MQKVWSSEVRQLTDHYFLQLISGDLQLLFFDFQRLSMPDYLLIPVLISWPKVLLKLPHTLHDQVELLLPLTGISLALIDALSDNPAEQGMVIAHLQVVDCKHYFFPLPEKAFLLNQAGELLLADRE